MTILALGFDVTANQRESRVKVVEVAGSGRARIGIARQARDDSGVNPSRVASMFPTTLRHLPRLTSVNDSVLWQRSQLRPKRPECTSSPRWQLSHTLVCFTAFIVGAVWQASQVSSSWAPSSEKPVCLS